MTDADTIPDDPLTTREPPPADGRRAAWASALAVLALTVWVYRLDLVSLEKVWRDDPNYSHGYLVIPVSLLVVWRRRTEKPFTRPLQLGWVVVAASLAVRVYAVDHGHHWLSTVTLIPLLLALAATLGGTRLVKWVWPSVTYLLFMLPLPPRVNALVAQPLQQFATDWSAGLLDALGLWVIAEGNVIYVGKDPLNVAEACNGLSMLMSLLATVTALVLLMPMRRWKQVVLLLSAVPIALGCNVLRIVATVWCVQRFGMDAGSKMGHDLAGWLMMPLAMALVGLELGLLTWMFREVEVDTSPLLLGRPIERVRPQGNLPGEGV